MNQAVESRKYFDLHLRGLGYLSRVRDVTTKGNGRSKAKPFLACAISAFHGDPNIENGIVYLPLDLIVSGDKAKEVVRSVMDDANDHDTKVLIGFRSGDHYIRTFERTGNRAGETGAVLKGRLLKVFWIKVDGEVVYRDEGDDTEAGADTQAPDGATDGQEDIGHSNGYDNASVDHRDPSDDATAQRAIRPDADGDMDESASQPTATERSATGANRYPALRRNGGGNVRRPAAGDR